MKLNKIEFSRWGIFFAIAWNIIILGTYSIVSRVEEVSFFENIETDIWYSFGACYLLATIMWYYIGYVLRKDFVSKKEMYFSTYKHMNRRKVDLLFNLHFFRKYSRFLTSVFASAIPWYMIANVRGELRKKDIVYLGIFTGISLVLLFTSKTMTELINTFNNSADNENFF